MYHGDVVRPAVLYKDSDLLVVDKPPGWLTHYNSRDPRAQNLSRYLQERLEERLYTVHRLDRGTSGLLIFARTRETAVGLSRLFRQQQVRKTYLAVVRGHLRISARIDSPVHRGRRGGIAVSALTYVMPLSRAVLPEPVGRYEEAWYSLVGVHPRTGRFHQIRRHLSAIDHPVIGDTGRGDKEQNRFFAARFGLKELLLRAYRLRLVHPVTGLTLRLCAGVPVRWRMVLADAGLALPPSLDTEPSVRVAGKPVAVVEIERR